VLRQHPAYVELHLTASPAQLATIKRLGDVALRDPILVTRDGVIIDGYARKGVCRQCRYSNSPLRGVRHWRRGSTSDGPKQASALCRLARLQPDSNGLSTEECFANPGTRQSARWGRFKGSSKLTEANVRKEIAVTAGVSEGNVTKFDQLHNSDPQILNALATGEIRIHRAWVWRDLPPQEQREELRRYRLNKGLKQPVKTHASGIVPVALIGSCSLWLSQKSFWSEHRRCLPVMARKRN
jgi:hypothetical protein